jgi:hypothetical protein
VAISTSAVRSRNAPTTPFSTAPEGRTINDLSHLTILVDFDGGFSRPRKGRYRANMNNRNVRIRGSQNGPQKADDPENNNNSQGKPRKRYNPVYVSHSSPPDSSIFKLSALVGHEMTALRFS